MTFVSDEEGLRRSEAADYAREMLSFEMAVARYQIRTYNPFAHQLRGLLHGEIMVRTRSRGPRSIATLAPLHSCS